MMLKKDHNLEEIIEHFKIVYGAHTIILYGSRPRNEAFDRSDYNIIAIRDKGKVERDFSQFNKFHLDSFIYSENDVTTINPYLIRIKDGIVLIQKDSFGDDLLKRVNDFYEKGAPKTEEWEVKRNYGMDK